MFVRACTTTKPFSQCRPRGTTLLAERGGSGMRHSGLLGGFLLPATKPATEGRIQVIVGRHLLASSAWSCKSISHHSATTSQKLKVNSRQGGGQRTKYVLHNSTVVHVWNCRSKRGCDMLVICIGTAEAGITMILTLG
jgi:hypothetical protein